MSETAIAFPHLNIYLENVPKQFHIFDFPIALYGVMLALAMVLGFMLAAFAGKLSGLDPELYWDFSVPAIICSVCGARAYYVVMSWDAYKDDPVSVLYLRQGGLAIYGGVIAGIITMMVFCRIKKVGFFAFADNMMIGLILGQIVGRWGNFFNREAFGDYTDNLLAMQLPVAAVRSSDLTDTIRAHMDTAANTIQVHPTFLYEGMWNTLVLIFLLLYRPKKAFDGEIFLLYIVGYGIGRFFIESLRTDQLILPGTSMPVSMLVSSVSAVAAIAAIIIIRVKKAKNSPVQE